MAEFTEAIRAALPSVTITHNALWWANQSDSYVKREIDSANVIELERGFNDGASLTAVAPSATRPSWTTSTGCTRVVSR